MSLRSQIIRVAYTNPELRPALLPLLRKAMEFPTERALKKYLKKHPNADPSKHSVAKPGKDKIPLGGRGGILDVDEESFSDTTVASEDEVRSFQDHPAVKALGEEFNLKIIAGPDGKITRGDLRRALHVAAQIQRGIGKATDYCNVNPPACKGNLGITRDNMPQVMDEPIKDMLSAMSEKEYDEAEARIDRGSSLEDVFPDRKKQEAFMKRKKGLAAVEAGADPESSKSPKDIWFDTLREKGIEINDDEIEVGKLIASQAEIKAKKSYGIAKSFLTGKFANLPDIPILVARDPKTGEVTVIDGHHRYAGLLTADPTRKMKVQVIEAPIREALSMAFDVPGVFRANLQDEIVPEDKPLDLAREKGSTWKQKNGKWYGKNQEGKTGGPFKSKSAAEDFAGGKGKTAQLRSQIIRLAYRRPEYRACLLPLLSE